MTLRHATAASEPESCPGVVASLQWDDASHLRGEIHTTERLERHAAEVARAHGRPSRDAPPGPLRQRFVEARERIARAYAVLSPAAERAREPSPAEEWLLDSSHVVDDQIREVEQALPWSSLLELPRIADGKMRGHPRVYGLCLDYLRHTDGRVDLATLTRYVRAYQRVRRLTIGELWAVPMMLRVGLVLAVGALAPSEARARNRERGETWATRVIERGRSPQRVSATLAELEQTEPPVTPELLALLLRRIREHGAPLAPAFDWVSARCARMGMTPEELLRRHHLKQAADRVAVGNAITSMRAIGALDWNAFFERTSAVERRLRLDPARAYVAMDVATRDRYRHAVERLARRSARHEQDVAKLAVRLARTAATRGTRTRRAHVGYWLVGDGLARLEKKLAYRPRWKERVRRAIVRRPSPFHFGAVLVATGLAWLAFASAVHGGPAGVLLAALLALPASELGVALVNALVVAMVPPRVLPKMAWSKGVPADHRTLVVLPAVLDEPEAVTRLVESLEVRSLANPDENLHFALLTDLPDADRPRVPEDDALIERARRGIAALEARWSGPGAHRYVLLHRRRVRDASGTWMGWERKRGKLEELNRLLRGRDDTSYEIVTAPRELLRSVKYVLTLDADTDLPRDAARMLAATLAHPLNRPRVAGGRVVGGHAIVQPRVGTLPSSARRTLWSRVTATPTSLDAYTTATSGLYQDLWGQGSFVGKGIYDVDAFRAALDGPVAPGRILHHDLFEGILARSALASDVEVLDEQPSSYEVGAARLHGRIRGDWQLLPSLLRDARELGALGSWKIVDDLRRSAIAPSLALACSVGWLAGSRQAGVATAALIALFFVPLCTRAVLSATRRRRSNDFVRGVGEDVAACARSSLVQTIFLLDGALLATDAIARTLYRVFWSRRHLLDWTTTSQTERRVGRRPSARLLFAGALAAGEGAAIAWHAPAALPIAAPVLAAWILAPAIAWALARPLRRRAPRLEASDRELLRRVARRTWRFFETFVTEDDHFLPPDNFQEDPRGVVAHRTSPTSIGLYLTSIAAARDLGYLSLREVVRRYEETLDTVEQLERREGHLLNGYDTQTLAPLGPAYVSTADSGNLAAHSWTVAQACEELARTPLALPPFFDAADDALALASEVQPHAEIDALRAGIADARTRSSGLEDATDALRRAREAPWAEKGAPEMREWLACAARGLSDALDEARERASQDRVAFLSRSLRTIAARARALADGMSFRLLFDEPRKLFSIGYDVGAGRRDDDCYDLLASEARLASLVAVAKGDAPRAHWFRLGRPLGRVESTSERVLLSWSGSMFEYLMPLLLTKSAPGTLLDATCRAVVKRQIDYGALRGVPWGVSESAFHLMDLAMTYQYRAFGVPGLGLKAGLGEDLVVAPYATALAAQLRPREAAENFRALERMGALGKYGFYDAVDFTARRLSPGKTSVVVKTFMAHHQGMTLVALDNALNGAPMPRRFHADARVKASELLLEERVPNRAPLAVLRAAELRTPVLEEPELDVVEHVGLGAAPLARLHLLGQGELSTAVSVLGEGFTTWRDVDVYRFREDQALEAGGLYVYLRDRASGRVWSAGYQPTKAQPDFYDVELAIDRVAIVRRDGDVETTTEIVVSPEHPAEIRRITLANHGTESREIELTTYGEVVLAPRAADLAHRALSSVFVETEALAGHDALLAHGRARSPTGEDVWLAQVLFAEGDAWTPGAEHDTSRASFLGRGRTTRDPIALDRPLAGTTGAALDPILALRKVVRLGPGGHARVTVTTALATSRARAVELAAISATPHLLPRAFELAWADARATLKHLGVSAAQSHRFQRLLSAIVFPQPALRSPIARHVLRGRGRGGLWTHGLGSDVPTVVVRIDVPELDELFAELLRAHEFLRVNGFAIDLVALDEEAPGYVQPQHQKLLSLVRASPSSSRLDRRGGVFIRRAHEMTEEERELLLADARVVLHASGGTLARQLRRLVQHAPERPRAFSSARERETEPVASAPRPALAFDNGLGGFTSDGREYVAIVSRDALAPTPWSNVMAWPHAGSLVTESGASFTWCENSQRHRLTPWSNDPISDPSGEAFFVRDDEDGSVWSPTPLPAGGDATFVVRHGQGWSSFEHQRGELACTLSTFVSPRERAKIWTLRIRNAGARTRRLSVYGIVEWVLGETRERSRASVMTDWDDAVPALFAENPLSLHPARCAFLVATRPVKSFSGDRDEVFGTAGTRAHPVALDRVAMSGRVGTGLDPCGALQVPVEIGPGETSTLSFVLGEGPSAGAARTIARHYRNPAVLERDLAETKRAWRRMQSAVVVKTPDPAFDALVNHWLVYQVASCRLWGRSAFHESSGAYGFGERIQDVLALLHARPDLAREHLVRAAGRQFVEGDVQSWWHPGTGEGARTRSADDMVWLPYAVAEYVRFTGDETILDERVTFLKEPPLAGDEEERFGAPAVTRERASVYTHCARALDFAVARAGGTSAVGGGDKPWLLEEALRDFTAIARARRDATRVAKHEAELAMLAHEDASPVSPAQRLAVLGDGDDASELFAMLDPIRRSDSREKMLRYAVEPYLVAGDAPRAPPGRGGWTWYTAAAGWTLRIAIERVLGLRREGPRLRIEPCVPRAWERFEIDYRDGEGVVHVVVENPERVARGVRSIELEGRPIESVPLTGAPGRREVRVVMGRARS